MKKKEFFTERLKTWHLLADYGSIIIAEFLPANHLKIQLLDT
jgi:hypothetical protein